MAVAGVGWRLADRFVFEEMLGRGGMGTVWRAWDTVLDRAVAIKEVALPPSVDLRETDLREKVLREARLAGRLNHPGAVTVFDAVESDGQVFIVMELVRARTLQDVVRDEGALAPSRVAEIGLRVLDVLIEAHRLGIVHRDVKPGNIMVSDSGAVKLADFGIARLDGTDSTLTVSSALVGSPAYMAPEHIRTYATPSSDIWALAATLYYAVEGLSPFARDTVGSTIAAVLAESPPMPTRAGAELGRLLLAMLAKPVDHRVKPEEVRRRLTGIADGTGDVGGNGGGNGGGDATTVVAASPATGAPASASRPPSARRDGWLTFAGVLCALDFAWWSLVSLGSKAVQLQGMFSSVAVQKATSDDALSIVAILWAGAPLRTYDGKAYSGDSGPFELFALGLVSVPFLALLPTGLALLGRKRQLMAAAWLCGMAVWWVPASYGSLVAEVNGPPGDVGLLLRLQLLVRLVAVLAVVIAAIRVVRADSVIFQIRPVHAVLVFGVLSCGVLWLVVDPVPGASTQTGSTVILVTTVAAVLLGAWLVGPRRLGAAVVAGALFVLGARMVVDGFVLVAFDRFSFASQGGDRLADAPGPFVLTVLGSVAALVAGSVLTFALARRVPLRPR